ncbi:unnamed protein product [Colias eurytheme]|nr:unnamed protein product [Colias eurytheme]
MLGILSIACLVVTIQALPTDVGSNKLYNIHEKIIEEGYPVETHDVVTEDGYILELIRIPYGKKGKDAIVRPPVLLMHGLSDSAAAYISLGPDSLAYNLVEEGADVWLGNARGVANSRRHIKLNPDDEKEKFEFFDFTFEEIGMIDLPAMIDYILEKTGEKQVHYVGHSQGGTVFLILNSMRPEYNDKISSAHLLAGVGYQNHFPSSELRIAAISTDLLYSLGVSLGFVEVLGPNWGNQITELQTLNACASTEDDGGVCSRSSLDDIIKDILNPSELLPGSALKQFAHYGQNIRDKKFRRWSYGLIRNLSKYGSITPPEYDLSKITVDITMHYTVNDMLLDEQDVLEMAAVIPNASVRRIPRETFTHTDFVTAEDAKELVVDYIVNSLSAFVR